MKGKFWTGMALLLGAAFLVTACGAASAPRVAEIVQDGTVIRRVDLAAVTDAEDMTVPYGEHSNTIRIAPGEIRMLSADCPDQICVKSGKLIEGGLPIVCLPHRLVIQWAD